MNLIKLNIKKPTQPNFIKGHKIEQKGLKTINIRDLKIFFNCIKFYSCKGNTHQNCFKIPYQLGIGGTHL